MSWNEIRDLNEDELVTIGAHSVNHTVFDILSDEELKFELNHAHEKIEHELSSPCLHLAYPFGDTKCIKKREEKAATNAGYLSAVTTRKGVIQVEHVNRLIALPRIHLHGNYQSSRYVSLATSGFPYFVANKFHHHVAI